MGRPAGRAASATAGDEQRRRSGGDSGGPAGAGGVAAGRRAARCVRWMCAPGLGCGAGIGRAWENERKVGGRLARVLRGIAAVTVSWRRQQPGVLAERAWLPRGCEYRAAGDVIPCWRAVCRAPARGVFLRSLVRHLCPALGCPPRVWRGVRCLTGARRATSGCANPMQCGRRAGAGEGQLRELRDVDHGERDGTRPRPWRLIHPRRRACETW